MTRKSKTTRKKTTRDASTPPPDSTDQLTEFARRLDEAMKAHKVKVATLSKWTRLRPDTLRGYLNARNNPTNTTLRRLTMIFGAQLGEPFEGVELAGPEEEAIEAIFLPNGRGILVAFAIMPKALLMQIMALVDQQGVEEAPPLYGSR